MSHPRLFPFLLQDIESENVNVVKRLFKIQNINASTIRTVMVAHCRRHDNPDLLLDYEAQSQARRQKGEQQSKHQPLLFDLGTSGSEEDDEEEDEGEECQREARGHGFSSSRLPQSTLSSLDHVIHVSWVLHVAVLFGYYSLPFFVVVVLPKNNFVSLLLLCRVVKKWGPESLRLRPMWLR